MSEMTVSDARARLADVVDAARVEHTPVYAEDLADLEAAAAARAEMEDGNAAIPWEQVRADLGLA